MLINSVKKSDTFPQKVRYVYNHKYRRYICISIGSITLPCRISLQFYCDLINNNKSIIILTWNIARFLKLLTTILYILHSVFTLKSLIEDYKKPEGKKEVVKIIGKSANLLHNTIDVLMQMKIIHFLVGYNISMVSHISLASTILFLFISEPISYCYTFKKYRDNKDPNKFAEYRNDLIISTLTLSLGLLNFILKRVGTATIPMDLGNGVICNFNWSVAISILYSAVLLATQVEKLFNQPINGVDPSSGLEDVHYHANGYVPNGDAVEV